jgi:DNA end-binding protein Ku
VLANDDLVRGYETADGRTVVITDEEFESVAPEMSADIRLKNFVPIDQIPPLYFQKSYFLSPSGKSATAYNLLAATMTRTGRAGVGSFVMRGHEYLVAIVSDNGVLRADTLRYADEVRSPGTIGLPARTKSPATLVSQFAREVEALQHDRLSLAELADMESDELKSLVKAKARDADAVIHRPDLEDAEPDAAGSTAQVFDLTEVLRRSLSKRVVVRTAQAAAPISLAERQASRGAAGAKPAPKKRSDRGRGKKSSRMSR